jgi:methyl-accepting chemotaxis protein
MDVFRSMTLRRKLLAMAIAILSVTTAISAVALVQATRLSDATREVTGNYMPSVQTLLTLSRATTIYRIRLNLELLEFDRPDRRAAAQAAQRNSVTEIAALRAKYERLIFSDDERNLYQAWAKLWGAHEDDLRELRTLIDSGKRQEAMDQVTGPATRSYETATAALDRLVAYNERGADQEVKRTEALGTAIRMQIGILTAVAIVLGLVLAVWLARAITRPVDVLLDASRKLAAGDFTAAMPPPTRDEIGALAQAMTSMRDELSKVIAQVRSGATAVATASQQIATGAQDLSARTEQQAASLEETASAMDQLSGTIRGAAEIASDADGKAGGASAIAKQGGAAVARVVETMNGIAQSSRRVADIISVIDGIAFQTNILALNAAVEAARAGDQGRGFAVVASEVRTLAQRSGEAAREIKSLIEASAGQVEVGTRAAAEAGTTVERIVASIAEVRAMVSGIATSVQQQAQGIGQINEAVAQIDSGTQQNAALVEQTSAASVSLREQASGLERTVAGFRVAQAA